MKKFIRVLANDPHNEDEKCVMFIAKRLICMAYTVYGMWTGHGNHVPTTWSNSKDGRQDDKLCSFILVDVNGNEYSCGDPSELQKLGIDAENLRMSLTRLDDEVVEHIGSRRSMRDRGLAKLIAEMRVAGWDAERILNALVDNPPFMR